MALELRLPLVKILLLFQDALFASLAAKLASLRPPVILASLTIIWRLPAIAGHAPVPLLAVKHVIPLLIAHLVT